MNPLPLVPDVTTLSKRVIRILGQNGPSKFVLQGTNTYLIGTGKSRILLDTGEGVPEYLPHLTSVLDREKCSISKVLLSHWHHDHVDGLPSVRDLLQSRAQPDPEVWKFPHESDEEGWLSLRDQDEIQVEGATLRAVHTPGHTTDHLSFLLLEDNVLFTADHILGGSTSVFEDLKTYMSSLRKLDGLQVGTLYPGHGLEMKNGVQIIKDYINHRQAREDQIVKVLQEIRSGSAMDIVKVVYRDVREDLHFAAEHGVTQHLAKLEQEGRVSQQKGDHWKLTGQARI
ncbi:protein of unknown function [Taphrina deformans PYCC 5710]|uniref:Metallo-beta-lactamase domain-containing protein n=1 Tax=Taphrina deformans (strain PYCC 5710 / ATCC 11124 / CBS 356.35 / IMI 108563 / JCM 9778 / NBRC 8474) TaxID=1097556 RepID=R4XEH3_TAPDE|nr:protein of unknown function [Taphrina deformans PYCC 5710]|eukprot:CCG84242.1 protein of unknown function [Taphrina deformans PYCC 5710]